MRMKNAVRSVAGALVFVTALLGYVHNPYWLFVTMFVGLSFFQSGFTGFCPMEIVLGKLGVKD